MASGAKIIAMPTWEPVKQANVEQSRVKMSSSMNGGTPTPMMLATPLPTMRDRPESARQLATGMTPAVMRMIGLKRLSRNSVKSRTLMSSITMAATPGMM